MTHISKVASRDKCIFVVCIISYMLFNIPAYSQTKHVDGFWKCRVTSSVKGEFLNEDPVGLAGHAHIHTDCGLHWSEGHGKTYCFASNPSFPEFENNPAILAEAHAFWSQSNADVQK